MENKTYNGGTVITENKSFILTRPQNTQDMNYHVYDKNSLKEHLIDICDVVDTEKELEEYGGVLFEDLKTLDVDIIEENTWKIL